MTPHTDTEVCPVCGDRVEYLERFYDRFGIYSGKACSDRCGDTLPGRGAMADYVPEEPVDDPG